MANRRQRRYTKEIQDDYTQSTKTIIITLLVVLIIVLLFYLMTVIINNKNRRLNTKEKEKKEAVIQYREILGDDTFTMNDKDYYVVFYDFESPDAVYIDYLVDQYAETGGSIYTVDLSKKFNSKFLSEETNSKAKKAGELKVKHATLIEIKDGKNVKYVEGNEDIMANNLK